MVDIDKLIHTELLPLRQSFLSYEQLANGSYRFDAKIFRKAAQKVQVVIEIARSLTTEEK
jgi:hypothetical protein